MTSPHPTQEQRNALHALGIDDDVIQLLTPEDREKAIRYLTRARVQISRIRLSDKTSRLLACNAVCSF